MLMWLISVSCVSFFIRLLGFPFDFFTLVIFGASYILLFGMSQGSVLKTVLWPIMVHLYKLGLKWKVVSLTLIPHRLISIEYITCFNFVSYMYHKIHLQLLFYLIFFIRTLHVCFKRIRYFDWITMIGRHTRIHLHNPMKFKMHDETCYHKKAKVI